MFVLAVIEHHSRRIRVLDATAHPCASWVKQVTRPYRTKTQRRQAFPDWLHTYNHHRGHTALKGRPPASRVPNLMAPQGAALAHAFPQPEPSELFCETCGAGRLLVCDGRMPSSALLGKTGAFSVLPPSR
jgi:hypothetical protein